MEDEKIKTPDEYADKKINKLIGLSIAKRKLQIKKLEVEIAKLKSGEMTPDCECDDSSLHNPKPQIQTHPFQSWQPQSIITQSFPPQKEINPWHKPLIKRPKLMYQ